MDMKEKLIALGYKPGQLKGKDEAELQAMHDTKVLEFREQGVPLPWETLPNPGGDGGAGDGPGDGAGAGAGDGPGDGAGAGDGPGDGTGAGDGHGDGAGAGDGPGDGAGAGDGHGDGAGDGHDDGAVSAMDELMATLQPATARFGFKFTTPDVLCIDNALVLPGQVVDVEVGDQLHLSEKTKAWLWKQGLIKG